MLIDLHTHTRPISWDSSLSPDELIELAKAAGLDGVCLTEHDYFWDPADAEELARKHNFVVIPGIEMNTERGHILVYGLHKSEFGVHRIEKLVQVVEAAGGAMVAAHPYRRYMPWYYLDDDELDRALQHATHNPAYPHCAGLERIHGRGAPQQNDFSARLCDLLDLPGTAGSDAHLPDHVGRCATRFERPVHGLADLVTELRAGRFAAVDLAMPSAPESGVPRLPR